MKKFSITAVFLGVLAMGLSASPATAQIQVSVSIGGFYDELSPYGEWVDCSYGDCWVPDRVERDWQPYSNGEWIYTDYGWTWVSYDPWGEDPYHYGSWTYLDRYGWSWVPGTVWAPAWVTWSYSDNYVGWAPLPPNYAFGYSGYSGRPIVLSPTRYVFVPTDRFVGSNVSTVRIAPQQTATIFRQTTPITRFGVTGGIVRNTALPIDRIQRATRTRIEKRSVRAAPRPIAGWTGGSRGQVSIVAPAREVRAAIASRPQKGSRSGGFGRGKAGGNERINRQAEPRKQAAPAPAQPVSRDRNRGRGRSEAQPQAAPAQVQRQPKSNAPVDRGRGRPDAKQAAPQVQRQPVVHPQAQPDSSAPAYRERGRGRPAEVQPQAAQPQAQPNPRSVEKPGKGRGPQKENPGKGQGKGKGKDKDKPE